jgi:preprotein translocase subunit SecF
LIIGVLIGTYSSIYVASPSVLYLNVSTTDLIVTKKEEVDDGMP